jgi:hypothetical protein
MIDMNVPFESLVAGRAQGRSKSIWSGESHTKATLLLARE